MKFWVFSVDVVCGIVGSARECFFAVGVILGLGVTFTWRMRGSSLCPPVGESVVGSMLKSMLAVLSVLSRGRPLTFVAPPGLRRVRQAVLVRRQFL